MKDGKKESVGRPGELKRVSDLVPEGYAKTEHPTIKDYVNKDIVIQDVKISKGVEDAISELLIYATYKDKTITITSTAKVVNRKLWDIRIQFPVLAKITKGKRYYDVG